MPWKGAVRAVVLALAGVVLTTVLCPRASLFAQDPQDSPPPSGSLAQPPSASPFPAPLAYRVPLHDVEGEILVGDRGTILVDGKQVACPVRSLLTGIAHDGTNYWVVGHDRTILRSPDGATWETVSWDPGERDDIPVRYTLLDIHWVNGQVGLIAGSFGLVLRTTDGGATWTESMIQWTGFDPEEDFNELHLYRFSQAPGGRLYCAADEGVVFRSSDQGATWDRLDTGEFGALFSVIALDDRVILASGIQGMIVRSEDAGDTWKTVSTSTRAILHGLIAGPDRQVWAVGDGGTLLKSRDAGLTFAADNLAQRLAITGGAWGRVLLTERGPVAW